LVHYDPIGLYYSGTAFDDTKIDGFYFNTEFNWDEPNRDTDTADLNGNIGARG